MQNQNLGKWFIMQKNKVYWFLAFLFVAGFILCSQDPVTFPWAWLGGLTCFAALGWIANKLLEVE